MRNPLVDWYCTNCMAENHGGDPCAFCHAASPAAAHAYAQSLGREAKRSWADGLRSIFGGKPPAE